MELGFKDEDIKFRDEVRDFIKETYTDDMRKTLSLSKNGHAGKDLHIKWQKALYERGWMAQTGQNSMVVQDLLRRKSTFLNQKWLVKELQEPSLVGYLW